MDAGSDTGSWFDTFYREHFWKVERFLLRLGAEPVEAEDAVQGAMESLLLERDSVRDPAAWVRVVARNNWLRAVRRQPVAVPSHEIEVAVGGEDPAWITHRRSDCRDATELIRQLPRTQREIVALIADGYTASEIATALRSSPAVVRSNLAHARRRLRGRPPVKAA